MKTNVMKYMFFIIVILMIGLAIYFLYIDSKEKVYAVEKNELEINMIKEINIGIYKYDTINPMLSNNRDIQYINKLIFEPLIDITYDFKIENKLAKEISKINDLTYIIKLNEDIYWHDGEKFTTKDVKFTINCLKNYNIDSIYKENVKCIQEVQIIDDYTVKVILNEETAFFEYMMCIPIIASHSYDEKLNLKTELPIGTGKFKIAKIENEKVILEKLDSEKQHKIAKINLLLKQSSKDLYTALSKNEIDYMITDNIKYQEYCGSLGYNVTEISNREFDYLVLNNENLLLKDKEIRKAINYAIDRNKINYNVYNNKYKISKFPLSYGSYLNNENDELEYDINKAKTILIEKGWKIKNGIWKQNGKILTLRLLVNKENEKKVEVAENIKKQLEEFGILIDIISVKKNTYDKYIKYKNYDMILTGNIVSNNPNLETYFGDNNLSNFGSQEIQDLIKQIKNIGNQEELLKEKYIKIKEIYKEEIPFISLYCNRLFILSNKNLKGDLKGNWYNVFYNIENWYKVDED